MAEAEPSVLAQVLGRVAYEFSTLRSSSMLPTYLHLVVSALFPIYTGAHASLSRPSSAAKPAKKQPRADGGATDDEDDDDEAQEHVMEGLSPKDALLMPLFAGTALASLYFLLQWMKDPALLNKILNAYFAVFGVFSVSRLVTDMLDMGHSLIFPRRYALDGTLYRVDGKQEKALPVAGHVEDKQPIASPLPGFLARLRLPPGVARLLWDDRAMPGNKWTLHIYLHRMGAEKLRVGPHAIVGILVGLSTVAYFNLVDKPWYLTNLLGFGFSYGALQLMSPTTFATGSMILGALFFYDIYFVFYTPMMVTVAKSLDVPIKLMFPRPGPAGNPAAPPSHAMLGLGDVVLPGIMIGLALRFDLYLFYLRQQKRIPAITAGGADTIEKPQYFSLAGRWTDHFWAHSLTGRPLWVAPKEQCTPEKPFTFPKTYFRASLVGYVVGLLATLGVMMVWNHAQPALLYLVPGVLGSLWLTALVRGELGLMWGYTEEVEEESESKKKTDDNKEQSAGRSGSNNVTNQHTTADSESEDDQARQTRRVAARRPDREVFSFSIIAPWKLKQQRSVRKEQQKSDESRRVDGEKHNWAPIKSVGQPPEVEPAGKRVRLN